MIIDSHVHIGPSLFCLKNPKEHILKSMQSLGIDKVVLIPLKPFDYHFEEANNYLSKIQKENSDKFIPFGRIDPWRKGYAVDEVDRIFNKLNFKGLFIDPLEEHFPLTHPILKPILDKVHQFKKPVMISGGHVRVSHPRQIEYIAKEYPNLTFIITSGGQINICGGLLYDAAQMLKECPNVIMETSGIYRRDFIEQMTQELGSSRIIYGSGSPYYNQSFELERIKTAHISATEKDKILSQNALSIIS